MNVFNDGAVLVKSILTTHFTGASKLLDSTSSVSAMHKAHGRFVVRGDIRPEVKPHYIGTFDALPFADNSFQVGFLDPPFKRGVRAREDYYVLRYGIAPNNENACTKSYYKGMDELVRVCSCGMVVKFMDASDGHTFHDRRYSLCNYMLSVHGLKLHDVAVLVADSRLPQTSTGVRRFLGQSCSYFLVWCWDSKKRGVKF